MVTEVFAFPTESHAWADTARIIVAAAALWLAALVVHVTWRRRHDPTRTHLATAVSYGLALVMISGIRLDRLGEPVTFDLWLSIAVVTIGLYGALKRVRVAVEKPRRRHGDR